MTAKIIAIDGPAASGKSTVGKKLADHLGYLYFDTGVMYRAVTLAALRRGVALEDESAITKLAEEVRIDVNLPSMENGRNYVVLLDGEDITNAIFQPEIDKNVSLVSAYPGVRRALTAQQRRIGLRGEVVMVGRDIGTVVLPEADLKVYLDASVEERARRRYLEYRAHGEPASMEEITESMRKRDLIDSTREAAPLKRAQDAIRLDTDGLNADQVLDRLKLFAESEDV
ncbi:MAG: (d)CMP kinase [Anaerolineales bacterium]|jgi:cytidylate kinase